MASKVLPVLTFLVAACACFLPAAQAQLQNNENLPVNFPAVVLEGEEETCPTENQRQEVMREIVDDVRAVIRRLSGLYCLGSTQSDPANSCSEIDQQSCPSDYYWIRNGTGDPIQVYCDMNRRCCNATGGSMRVAYLNVTDQLECPQIHTHYRPSDGLWEGGRRWLYIHLLLHSWHRIQPSVWKD